jgi:hypothetical protein
MQGRMTAGALAMFFVAFTQSQALVRSLLQNAGQVYSNSLFLGTCSSFSRSRANRYLRTWP